jgi:hypothetical protein
MDEHSQPTEWQALQDYDVDILLIIPCGCQLGQTLAELSNLQDLAD